ncbi:hypothetical protein M2324_002323 [Rhodovulum sulfidophilum]|nr:hypothetical protein [Rhodovulum sulfidophilum]
MLRGVFLPNPIHPAEGERLEATGRIPRYGPQPHRRTDRGDGPAEGSRIADLPVPKAACQAGADSSDPGLWRGKFRPPPGKGRASGAVGTRTPGPEASPLPGTA